MKRGGGRFSEGLPCDLNDSADELLNYVPRFAVDQRSGA